MSNLIVTDGYGTAGDVPLAVAAFTVVSGTALAIQFTDELIVSAEALLPAAWSIASHGGIPAVTVLEVSVVFDTIFLTTSEHRDGGEYTLTLPFSIYGASDGGGFVGPFTIDYTGKGIYPFITMAKSIDERTVDVVFSEPVNVTDAETPGNYTIVGPGDVSVVESNKVTDQTYRLTTTPHERSTAYTIIVLNIQDLASNQIETDT